ncbi:nucleotidyltransferase family protein [Spongiibacter pelagi]|uniref:nucleotidyltransferase family protein n=1 Tax=Spongiibacter pelagi TaxID=2760804 RepID=UPI00295B4603|nr:nucleotidyltransferase family protein [Spongiibacter pelagi]
MNALLILAAGQSRRFGADKRFVTMPKGGPLLPALIRRGGKAGLPVTVVLAESDPLTEIHGAHILRSTRAAGGMGYSLADAIAQLDSALSSVLILPADLPLLRISSLRQVAEQAAEDRIIIPHFQGQRGHPVAIGRAFWPELLNLEGDQGAKAVLAKYADACVRLDLDDPGICADGDTPAAMQSLFDEMTLPE